MANKLRYISTVCVCLVTLLICAHANAQSNVLTFCYDPYPPYTFGTTGAPQGGLKVELLNAVVAEIEELEAETILLPWKRCQALAKRGTVDGILPLFKNEERATYLEFTKGTFPQLSTFWYNKAKFPDGLDWYGNFEKLSHLKLGMLNGAHIHAEMEQVFADGLGIQRARDMDSLLGLLTRQRVDLIAIDDNVGRYMVSKLGLTETIGAIKLPISLQYSYFGLSKTSGADKYVGRFNQVISELDSKGTIESLHLGQY